MAVRVNISLPDELHDRMKAAGIENVSAICQEALRNEVEEMETIAKLSENMEQLTVDVEDKATGMDITKTFVGRWLIYHDDESSTELPGFDVGMRFGVALTRRRRFAVYSCDKDGGGGVLESYDSLEAAAADHIPNDILERAKAELTGITCVEELDI